MDGVLAHRVRGVVPWRWRWFLLRLGRHWSHVSAPPPLPPRGKLCPHGCRWLGLCETPVRFRIDRERLTIWRPRWRWCLPLPLCLPLCSRKIEFAAADVQRASVQKQDVRFVMTSSSGSANLEGGGGGCSVERRDAGQPTEVRGATEQLRMASCNGVLCEPFSVCPLAAMAACKCGQASHTVEDVGTAVEHTCAFLAVEVRGEGIVEISRREWQPGQLKGLFAYKTALNDHLSSGA